MRQTKPPGTCQHEYDLTSRAALFFLAHAAVAHCSFRVLHHCIVARAFHARADLLAALALGPLEVLALNLARVADRFVSIRAGF